MVALLLTLIALVGCDAERGGVSAPWLYWLPEPATSRADVTPTRTTATRAAPTVSRSSSATPPPTGNATATPGGSATPAVTLPPTETRAAAPAPTSTPVPTATAEPAALPTQTHLPSVGAVHSGQATYYYATGGGACSFEPSPDDLMVAAFNEVYYGEADLCGAYVEVTGPKGSVVVRIVDLCPGCLEANLDLDLSQQAFEAIADLARGRVAVTWRVVSPELSGPIAYHFAEGSSQWWTGIQVLNHRNPISRLEYRDGAGNWVSVPRKAWNYFVQTTPAMGPGPYELRVTDAFGNQIMDQDIALTPGGRVLGSSQFPAVEGQ